MPGEPAFQAFVYGMRLPRPIGLGYTKIRPFGPKGRAKETLGKNAIPWMTTKTIGLKGRDTALRANRRQASSGKHRG